MRIRVAASIFAVATARVRERIVGRWVKTKRGEIIIPIEVMYMPPKTEVTGRMEAITLVTCGDFMRAIPAKSAPASRDAWFSSVNAAIRRA